MAYSITIEREVIPLSGNKFRLNAWVSSITGFEDPGVFVLHRTRTLFNGPSTPIFETFANPCSLVEYPYLKTTRNYGMYRDRELSLVFDCMGELEEFWNKLMERKEKLVGFMTQIDKDLANGLTYQIGEVTMSQSSLEQPFVKAVFHAETPIFMFGKINGVERFVGVYGSTAVDKDIKSVTRRKELTILTYSTRLPLFMEALAEDLANRTARQAASNSSHYLP